MAILPKGTSLELKTSLPPKPSKTYRLDLETNRIAGLIDKMDAMRQFVFKAYNTERFKHLIYSLQYGTDWWEVHNSEMPQELLERELERILTEAIIYDERITLVENFTFKFEGKSVFVTLEVSTIFGKFIHEQTLRR